MSLLSVSDKRYRLFLRSATNLEEFARAHKTYLTNRTNLTIEEARKACQEYNDHRNPSQVRRGTKLEMEEE